MLDSCLPMNMCKFLLSTIFVGKRLFSVLLSLQELLFLLMGGMKSFSVVFSLDQLCLPVLKVAVPLSCMESPMTPWKAIAPVPVFCVISFSFQL